MTAPRDARARAQVAATAAAAEVAAFAQDPAVMVRVAAVSNPAASARIRRAGLADVPRVRRAALTAMSSPELHDVLGSADSSDQDITDAARGLAYREGPATLVALGTSADPRVRAVAAAVLAEQL